jgi:hypothetical protein
VEPHFVFPFIHWLPQQLGGMLVRISPWYLLSRPGKAHAREYFNEVNLLGRSEVADLFPDAEVKGESFAMLRKSHLVFWTKLSDQSVAKHR